MAANEEVYLLSWFSPTGGSFTGISGGGGATWANLKNTNQFNVSIITWDDMNAAGHLATDLPEAHLVWGGSAPAHSDALIVAVGDGSTTPAVRNYVGNDGNGDNPNAHVTYFGPQIGDALVYVVATEGTIGATPSGYTVIATGSTGGSPSVQWACYMRFPSTGDGSGGSFPDDRLDFSVPLIGTNIHWVLLGWDISNPGAAAPYLLDDGPFVVSGGDQDFTSTQHGESAPLVDGASEGGLLLGDAEGSVEGGGTAGASDGGLLLGAAEPDIEGGNVPGASIRGLLRSRARSTIIPPFPPVPPLPAMTGQLGCGIYDVFIFTRGLGEIVGRIPFNQLQWSRSLDDTSQASVVTNGVSNTGPMRECCALLGSIQPYKHEIGIYRNGLREWSGPVVDVKFPDQQVQVYAEDLSHWLKIRWLHNNHNDVQQDLANIWVEYVQDAMSVENSAGLNAIVHALTGVLADRLYTQDMGTFAADAIAELARTGLDWYCVDRRMVGGPVAAQPAAYPDAPAIPTLTDESFRSAPEIDRNGDLMGNSWFVGGDGAGPGGNAIIGVYGPEWPGAPDFPDHVHRAAAPDFAAIENEFGRIERRVNETKILDQKSIDQNAATRYDLTKLPVDVISEGTLLPTAGIDIRQLVPGSIQNMHLTRACVQIGAPYRLTTLTVNAQSDGSEDVVGAWEPLGSEAAHEDL